MMKDRAKPFIRTNSGISNSFLFYNVDFVVYVEGGNSYTYDQVKLGHYDEDTEDILFWKNVFSIYRDIKKYKFKSVGSKTTLKQLVVDIEGGVISNTIVAMDRDFDKIDISTTNRLIFYTHGYSWENDVWNINTIYIVIQQLSADFLTINNQILNAYTKFLKDITFSVYADSLLAHKSKAFFPRKGHRRLIIESKKSFPEINVNEVEKLFNLKKLNKCKVYNHGLRNQIDIERFCYSHLLGDYCISMVAYVLKQYCSLKSVPIDLVIRCAINQIKQTIINSPDKISYYNSQFT
ncbi:hypothetical protein ACO2Q8_16785 [Larkinella sp. VNQ87]|uniref:hypothetical protein n=1 Tax=Larkinella sp. VNQ87 TaxID=3400921 RepID=UPI003C111A5A